MWQETNWALHGPRTKPFRVTKLDSGPVILAKKPNPQLKRKNRCLRPLRVAHKLLRISDARRAEEVLLMQAVLSKHINTAVMFVEGA